MATRKKKEDAGVSIRTHHHSDHHRPVIPDATLRAGDLPKGRRQVFAYNPHLDPVLRSDPTGAAERVSVIVAKVEAGAALSEEEKRILRSVARSYEAPWLEWAGKREAEERRNFQVDDVLLHIHERISAQAIINAVKRDEEHQSDLFAKPKIERDKQVQYYRHSMGWTNRLILGDSLQVMSSLARKESLAGKVQMVYIDPPYAINYSSNWQNEVGVRRVENQESGLTREPEMIKAYRDTWEMGIHSYLKYMKERLLVAHELLGESGSIFVQISDDHMHRVRALLDEVFGDKQFISQITFTKTRSLVASTNLTTTADYILWYAKDAEKMKSRKVVRLRVDESLASHRQSPSGEVFNSNANVQGRAIMSDNLVRKNNAAFEFEFEGRKFVTGFRTNLEGMNRAAKADRLMASGKSVRYKFYLDDYPVSTLSNVWADLIGAQDPVYVVQTNEEVVQRCMLMSTEPGDLVIDPTCGSGTTAYVAEQWGRRWITIDSSRVAAAIARQRLLTSTFEVYRSKDPIAGVDPSAPINPSFGFEYKKVPHITLKSIARNTGLDPIFARHEPVLQQRLEVANQALKQVGDAVRQVLVAKLSAKLQRDGARSINDGDLRRWLLPRTPRTYINFGSPAQRRQWLDSILPQAEWREWEVPFEADPDWPQPLQEAVIAYRTAWREKISDVNAEISRNADQDELVDRPEVLSNAARVSGPFTVEGVRPEELAIGEDGRVFDSTINDDAESIVANNRAFIERMMQLMRMDGVTFLGNRHVKFGNLESSMLDGIHALGAYATADSSAAQDIGVVFGPQYGPVSVVLVGEAVEAAKKCKLRELVIAGFSFDSAAQQLASDSSGEALQVNLAHIRPDVSPGMDGLLKDQRNSQLFTVFGQPEFKAKAVGAGEYQVDLGGVCVYNPLTGQVDSSSSSKVAAWFLDTDYDGNCFCPSQAFFPDSKAWDKISRALGSKTGNAEAFQAFAGSTSLPFKPGAHRRIAVKVIDPRGNEVMGIKTIA